MDVEVKMSQSKKYLTQKQVADILGVKVTSLNHWRAVQRYNIPYIKKGRIILYPETEFYNWLESDSYNMKNS